MQSPVPAPPVPREPADPVRGRNGEALIEHLLRRAGFGASQEEVDLYADLGFSGTVRRLLDFQSVPDTVDDLIGRPGVAAVTARGAFLPASVIADARQRWLFRMVHTQRPLQEKMALFWHNHFATAYTKIAGAFGSEEATRYMAAKPAEDPDRRARADRAVPASSRSATSAICWSRSRRIRRCWCGSTAAPTSRAARRRTSPAS